MTTTIFVTTPCFNARETIDNTILSVVTQEGDFSIRYHIQDGGSTDGTRERLEWWARRLQSKAFPIQCLGLDFSFASAQDEGMYDAICLGFEAMDVGANDFMTWINADDILMAGALSFVASVDRQFAPQQVSWVGGAACVMRDGMTIASYDRAIPRSALRAGLCDGIHWAFLQQEGTFFRKWLWNSIDPDRTFRPMKLAGDWNLWRLFAGKSALVQWKVPLGGFRTGGDQLSVRQRDQYMAEMEALAPTEARRAALAALPEDGMVKRRLFSLDYKSGALTVSDEVRNGQFQHHHQKVFGGDSKVALKEAPLTKICTGELGVPHEDAEACTSFEGNILAFDREWQFPAVTEQHAFHRMRAVNAVPEGVTYVAYPWATLIDKIQTKARDAHIYLREFRTFCRELPKDTVKVTVCQHILLRRFLYLFEQAGIHEVFWTHATWDDVSDTQATVRLHPFPLYPVQVTKEAAEDTAERPYLFSFIGAKSNKYYLTRAREWILDRLADHPRGLIIGRDSWHYNKVVYEHQIRKTAGAGDALIDQSATDQFKMSLQQSIFSLCPAGSGPNSIRLWESIGAGSIPVILADTYAPPGDIKLWEQGALFCEETPEAIEALPARLAEVAADPERLAAMRKAMRQLWLLYGPESFISDVQHFMLERAGGQGEASPVEADGPGTFLDRLVGEMQDRQTLSQEDALLLLRTASSEMLIAGGVNGDRLSDGTTLGQLLVLAREALPKDHPTLVHFDRVLTHLEGRTPVLAAPAPTRGEGPRICLFGRHSNRTPLSYAPFQRLAEGRVQFVAEPARADVVMTGFNLDLRENAKTFAELAESHADARVMVISEEPLWDSVWSGGFAEQDRVMTLEGKDVAYRFLNHQNSSVFDFERIPYFLLTNDDFLTRYGILLSRQTDRTPAEMLAHWQAAPVSAAFFAEVRDDVRYAQSFPDQDVHGLSVYRTEVARLVTGENVLREGKGWATKARRQDLVDWHLDKLAALDGRVRVASAFENTHQNAYISEKIFDAFAVGGLPTYYAGPQHRVLDLVPTTSMLNTYGMTAEAAAEAVAGFVPDEAFARSWLETAGQLRDRFTDTAAVLAERRRVLDAVLSEVEAFL
jgi:hypothetical protein